MSTSIKNANPNVSNAILKALGNDARGRPQISATEMKSIAATATSEIRHSENPKTTLRNIKSSFELANRVTGGEYKAKFSELVSSKLTDVADRRAQSLRQPDTHNWSPRSSRGSTT